MVLIKPFYKVDTLINGLTMFPIVGKCHFIDPSANCFSGSFHMIFSDDSSLCGKTVIHRIFVLTVAHCCIEKDNVVMHFKDRSHRNIEPEQFQQQ